VALVVVAIVTACSVLTLLQRQHPELLHALTLHGYSPSCTNSLADSRGFLCVGDDIWREAKAVALRQYTINLQLVASKVGYTLADFWQYNWEPELTCPVEQRLGRRSDGGKW